MIHIRALALLTLGVMILSACSHTPRNGAASVAAAHAEAETLRAGSLLTAKELQADVVLLRRAFETLHPGLYRYNTRAEMDEAFGILQAEFQRDRTLAEAYIAFSRFAAKVRCGHTYADFYNQKNQVQKALFQAGRVPFHFRWLGSRMIVTRSFEGDPRLRAGTEVESINGIPADSILRSLMTVARADGGNDAKRVSYLQVLGMDRYEAFDIFFPLFSSMPSSGMALRARTSPTGKASTFVIQPISYEQRLATMVGSEETSDTEATPLWDFRFVDSRTAYLRMPSWAVYNSTWEWEAFLDRSFDTLVSRGVRDLVIDVRGNEGGLSVGDNIMSHLVAKDLPAEPVVRRVRYRKVPEDLVPYLDTWDRSFFDWGRSAIDSTTDFFRLNRYDNDSGGFVVKPMPPRFTGRVWVLIGASNSSATFEFARAVKQNHLGVLVGQPSGGNLRGINGGALFFLRLPHSGIELDLPLIGQFANGDPPDAGLEPDILVTPTVNDVACSRDAEMEPVRSEIRRLERMTYQR